jgi:hypothetical protein
MTPIGTALFGVLVALAAVHAYWGLGGRWPGHDDASLVERVAGRTKGMRAPSPAACSAVAAALLAAAALVWLHSGRWTTGWAAAAAAVGFWDAALAFLLRGLAGFVPAAFRCAEGTPFHRLNRMFYSPLCLAIAAAFLASD